MSQGIRAGLSRSTVCRFCRGDCGAVGRRHTLVRPLSRKRRSVVAQSIRRSDELWRSVAV